jgi:hypothetical protein
MDFSQERKEVTPMTGSSGEQTTVLTRHRVQVAEKIEGEPK